MALEGMEFTTKSYLDQKPGTSGLRKKVSVFEQENYIANFVQSTFNALRLLNSFPEVLVVGGDGRYYMKEAIQIILRVAMANGVQSVWVGHKGLLSTPAVSTVIRRRSGGFKAQGAFILTASHNPGGPDADFGIKYNTANGGPAPEKVTEVIYNETLKISTLYLNSSLPEVDLTRIGVQTYDHFTVEVISSVEDYISYMKEIFDFDAIGSFLSRPDFTIHLDCLHGASGPYVQEIFHTCLGVPLASLHHTTPLSDFGGYHPDPNLTYAHNLVQVMGLLPNGSIDRSRAGEQVPSFGAAFDGDADRNMILGSRFFVNPSDSLAILVANAEVIPFFRKAGGLSSVARSMPTSCAVDRVAQERNLRCFEVPTGWKFFGNLMDSKTVFGGEDYNPFICGEESFGTGSNHIREKDGVWTCLFWLSLLASKNDPGVNPSRSLVGVQSIVEQHWALYGLNYYTRYDYENVSVDSANTVMENILSKLPEEIPCLDGKRCCIVDSFEYCDPIDGSITSKQGVRVVFEDNSRFVLRLSSTGTSGATIRLYLEKYVGPAFVTDNLRKGTLPPSSEGLRELIQISLDVSKIPEATGRDAPTVIT
ncbi:unnamed protein product [Phytomonas sp. Hart1]|nr:unnamed protein product [Phytomonas sp. Hart1]|eukprot:CCW71795.1 unnamed protein product [Phytomonas sp. isolate Hart1]